jgi:hypothetical protein
MRHEKKEVRNENKGEICMKAEGREGRENEQKWENKKTRKK